MTKTNLSVFSGASEGLRSKTVIPILKFHAIVFQKLFFAVLQKKLLIFYPSD